MEKPNEPLVQLVITRRSDGQIRVVEFSPTSVHDVMEFQQLEVALLILRKRISELSPAEAVRP